MVKVVSWPCMAASRRGSLTLIDDINHDDSNRMNSEVYTNILCVQLGEELHHATKWRSSSVLSVFLLKLAVCVWVVTRPDYILLGEQQWCLGNRIAQWACCYSQVSLLPQHYQGFSGPHYIHQPIAATSSWWKSTKLGPYWGPWTWGNLYNLMVSLDTCWWLCTLANWCLHANL